MDKKLEKRVELLAIQKRKLDEQYRREFNDLLYTAEPLVSISVVFQTIVEETRKQLVYFKGLGRPTDDAIHEVVRKAVTGEAKYSFTDLMSFYVTIRDTYKKTYDILFDTVSGYSDDSYSDFLDALFLTGENVLNRILKGEFEGKRGWTELRQAIKAELNDDWLTNRVLKGENYFHSTLENKLRYFFGACAEGKEVDYSGRHEAIEVLHQLDKVKKLINELTETLSDDKLSKTLKTAIQNHFDI